MARDQIVQNRTLSPDAIPDDLTPSQAIAMGSLLGGQTVTGAARAANVIRDTVHKWLATNPAFVAYYNQARKEMLGAVEQSLLLLSGTATITLRRLLTRRSVPDAVKLQAALAVLKHASSPILGPTEPQDARNEILQGAKRQKRATQMAKFGITEADLDAWLDRPITRAELDEAAELDDDLDDEDLDRLDDEAPDDDLS